MQGWRLEVKSYPRLTEHGAWRGREGSQYGGFYTQEEVILIIQHIALIWRINLLLTDLGAFYAQQEVTCLLHATSTWYITWPVCSGRLNLTTWWSLHTRRGASKNCQFVMTSCRTTLLLRSHRLTLIKRWMLA